MVLIEKSFPRGGVVEKISNATETNERIIFGAVQTKQSRKTKGGNLIAVSNTFPNKLETVSAELLNYETIQDGMNIMGVVKAVDQLYLNVSLPGSMTARVSALEISNAYTKITKEFLQQAESTINYKPLTDLYHVGQIVYGRVQELKHDNHNRTRIVMSLRPSEIHSELLHAHIKKGFIFNGAIEEVQEHGYIIESGIKGLRTFMSIEKSQPEHVIGELIFLKVDTITHDKSVSTCICKKVNPENLRLKKQNDPNIDYILPSTIVQFTVKKLLKDGLQGSIMNEAFTAYINEHQLAEPLALPEDYELNTTYFARVLYVMPLTKLVYLTLNVRRTALEEINFTKEPNYKRGDVVEKGKVHHHGTGGVILILDNKYKGLLTYRTIKANYKGNYDQDEILVKYAKKSNHIVRILGYDPMGCMYICTDDISAVNEKVFTLDDVQPGDIVTAVVKGRNDKISGYNMHVGKVNGIIEKLYLAPVPKTLEEKAKVRCRVVAVNTERKTIYLTNRSEYTSNSCKFLISLDDARVNTVFMGTIVKCQNEYILVKFFNQIKGVLYKQQLNNILDSSHQKFYEGQTMSFRILKKNAEQIILTLADDTFGLGKICSAIVVHTFDSGLEIKVSPVTDTETEIEGVNKDSVEVKGLVPIRLLSDHLDLLRAKLHIYTPETEIKAVCVVRNIFSIRDVHYFQSHLTKDFQDIKPGNVLKACVKNINGDIIELFVPIRNYGRLVKVHMKMLLVGAFKIPEITLTPDQVVYVKILSKEPSTRTVTVSAKLTDVWDGDLCSTALYTEQYLNEVAEIKKSFKKLRRPIAHHSIGEKVAASFRGVNTETNDWQFQTTNTKLIAIVKSAIVGKSQPPKEGDTKECVVLWIDYSNNLLFVSDKLADVEHINNEKKLPPTLVGTLGVNGKVLLKTDNLFICSLKKGKNPLVFCPLRLHVNDFENSGSGGIKENEFCKLAFIHKTKPIAVLESTWKLWKDISRKRKLKVEPDVFAAKKGKNDHITCEAEKVKKQNGNNSQKSKGKLDNEIQPPSKKKQKIEKRDSFISPILPFYEDKLPTYNVPMNDTASTKTTRKNEVASTTPPSIGDYWSTDLSTLYNVNDLPSSDDDNDNTPLGSKAAQTKKKLKTAEKFKLQREEEVLLREIEAKYADPNHLPESVDQFDRLVLSEPNNSKNWINYMVYHLQSTEIDKARAVARRSLKAISYRENREQLNVWVALLNLELRYGSKDVFNATVKEALTYNDPQKIYLRLVEILCDAKKTQQLIEVLGDITKKFKADPEVWRAAANAYFNIGMPERAQQLMHKALACLPEREHINTIVAFANLNYKYGYNEMAQTLLDQVVTSYPKRVDVWTQYVDMLVKVNLIDSARTVLDRAVIQKIPIKKMRTIFKKYLEFEERFGTAINVENVKKLASEYVKKNSNLK